MKTTPRLIITALTVIATIAGCQKEKTVIDGPQPLKSFFTSTTTPSQTFQINMDGSAKLITGQKGTRIIFYGNSLKHQNGSAVTGTVTIELKECYSVSDMVLSNKQTVSNGILLQSGGEVYLMAKQGSEELVAGNQGPVMQFPFIGNTQWDMQLFTGNIQPDSSETTAAGETVNWVAEAETLQVVTDTVGTSGGFGTYYSFTIPHLGWSNCDRFWNNTGGTDPMVKLPDGYTAANTCVMMVFKDEKTVATADLYNNHIFRFHAGEHTPIGLNVAIVAVAKRDGTHYYYIGDHTTAQGAVFNATMTESTESAIEQAVKQL